jgi:hypothetical protein
MLAEQGDRVRPAAIGQAAALRRQQDPPLAATAIHHSDVGPRYTSVRFAETFSAGRPDLALQSSGQPG